jgi:hypothetical protein
MQKMPGPLHSLILTISAIVKTYCAFVRVAISKPSAKAIAKHALRRRFKAILGGFRLSPQGMYNKVQKGAYKG